MKQRRALIFDDNPEILKLLGIILKRLGYHVTECSSPIDAPHCDEPCPFETAEQACVDLIITDVQMPNMTGIEYVRKIRQVNCQVRHVAMISGEWNEENQRAAKKMGCKIFTKPVNLAEVKAWVSSLETD